MIMLVLMFSWIFIANAFVVSEILCIFAPKACEKNHIAAI